MVPGGEVIRTLAQVRVPALLLAVTSSFTALALVAWRLKLLSTAYGLTLSTAGFLEIHLATLFYGIFLPGGNVSSIAVRFYKISRAEQKLAGAALALLADRFTATLILLIMGIGFWLLEQPGENLEVLLLMMAGLALLLVMAALALAPEGWPGLHRLRQYGRRVFNKSGNLREVLTGKPALSRKKLALIFLAAVLAHLIGIAGYLFLAMAVGVDISFLTMGWLRTAMILAAMLPISASGLGLREGATLYILGAYGGSPETALAFSLAVFAVTILLPGLVGGGLELRRLFIRTGNRMGNL